MLGPLSFSWLPWRLPWHLSTAVALCKAVIQLHNAAFLAMTPTPVYWRVPSVPMADLQVERILPAPSRDHQRSSALTNPDLPCQQMFQGAPEDVLCTGDGNGAAVSWGVMGGSACGIAVQTLNVLKVGWPPPLCRPEGMLSSSTSASGLPADILKSVHVMLPNLPVR